MAKTNTVIGAGHSGLAMSRRLTDRSIDHVVLERGEVANSWRTQRWPASAFSRRTGSHSCPAGGIGGDDPHGYMQAGEVPSFVSGYVTSIDAPVAPHTSVLRVRASGSGFSVVTDQGQWAAAAVVIASGASNVPRVPTLADALPRSTLSITTRNYHGPDTLPEAGVLIVGGSATGVQLAAEIQRSGRPVTLSMGEHVRPPTHYRGRDILWWMDAVGVLDQRYDEVDDIVRARHVPSPQLIGTPEQATLDVNALRNHGIPIVADSVPSPTAWPSSPARCRTSASSPISRCAGANSTPGPTNTESMASIRPDRMDDTRLELAVPLQLDLATERIETVLWATGYRPDHSWVDRLVFDRKGSMRHDAGVVQNVIGPYLLGQSFLRRRRSTFTAGASADSADLADHLHLTLDKRRSP